ncbi:MAG: class I fructose-bisphosphate aldolase [Candidatus Neomarinimicrobiota bacterium]
MNLDNLKETARAMVASGKGILAADESFPTIKKRFDQIGVESTEESRRNYRNMLFSVEGIEAYISGVIMFDETVRQSTADRAIPFPEYLSGRGIIPGIKVDKGAKPLAGHSGETITEGLDGLRDRLNDYYEVGARFAKWRAVISIGDGIPSQSCIRNNAQSLARYAALCQEAGLVPIVEPEVLMDGNHAIERSFDVTADVLHAVFDALYEERIALEGMILKPNMVLSGYECTVQASAEEVARKTVECFLEVVPAAVPGICFLSGGQNDVLATRHLNAMNALEGLPKPWKLSFSYGRALQQEALKTWGGNPSRIVAAREAFHHRAKCNGAATLGEYGAEMERQFTPAG